MSDTPKAKGRTSFTSWKLDIINAAGMDPNLKPATVRMLVRLVEALDEGKWDQEARVCEAYLGDDVLADEIPGFKDRKTTADHRVKLRSAEWLTFEEGSGRTATRYFLTDKPVNSILDRREELREERKIRRMREKVEHQERQDAKRERRARRGETSPKQAFETGVNLDEKRDVYPPVHLRDSPTEVSLRSEDMALEAPHSETEEVVTCHLCARLGRMKAASYIKRSNGLGYCGQHGGHSADFYPINMIHAVR